MKPNSITRVMRAAAACSVALLCLHALSAKATTLTNWARAGTATQSSDYSAQAVASKGIDGNTAGGWGDASTTHSATANAGEWWQVDLKELKPIGHIHVWFREDCCANRDENLRIVIYDSTNVTTRVVMWETNNQAWFQAIPRDLGFDVEPAVNGQVVFVEHMDGLPDFVSLAECEVFNQKLLAPTNYALGANGGVATSSSFYNGDPFTFGPQQGNDGNHMSLSGWAAAPYYWGYSAPDNTAGVDPLPWWRVDMPSPSIVGSVVLWPRRDRTYTRLQNIRLTVADAGSNVLYQQVTTLPSGPKFVINIVPAVANAQIVWLETTADTPDKFLNLPEVEVFAPLASAPTITFTTNLQDVTVEQNRPITIGPVAAMVDGGIRPEDISYRWYRNGVEIPNMAGSWLRSYTSSSLAGLANSGDKYKVQASVSGHGVFSSEVTLTVTNDITPPIITTNTFTVTALVQMNLLFSELMDPQSATNSANYVLAGGPTVGAITLGADGKTVTLVIQGLLLGDVVDLTVSGVKDLAGNVMVPQHIVAASPQTPINYARTGVAIQDSDYNGNTVASKAIDGNTSGAWGTFTIAATGGGSPGWWEVDLGQMRTIGSVVLYWRTDCCPRNADEDMLFYDSTNTATRVEILRISISGEAGLGSAPFTQDFGAAPVTARVVRIEHRADMVQTPGDTGSWQLHLAEVMVLPPPTGLQITTSPRSWTVNEGDRVLLKTAVTGTQPITYKWQRNGVDVPGETGLNLSFSAIAAAQAGTYTLVASNSVRVRTSDPASVVVNPRPSLVNSLIALYTFDADAETNIVDTAPMNPAKTVMHNGLNNNAVWMPSVADGNSVTRTGLMQFDGTTAPYSEIEATSHPDFDGPNTNGPLTVAFWLKAQPCDTTPGTTGAALFDRQSGAQGYGGYAIMYADPTGGGTNYIGNNTTGGYAIGTNNVSDDLWHHVVIMYAHVPYSIGTVYVDGKLDSDGVYDLPGSWAQFRNLMIGMSWDGYWKRLTGNIDDVYIFNRLLDATEVAQVMAGLSMPPVLSTSVTGNQLTITWSMTGYILQQNGAVNNAPGWADIAGATTGTYTVTIPTTGNNYYRLRKL